jgi:hypothetical protein
MKVGKKAAPKEGGEESKKIEKKDSKKSDSKKQDKKPAAKEEAKKPAATEQAKVDTVKVWEDSLKNIEGLVFYDYKTEFVNSKDKAATLQKLFGLWDEQALSFWIVKYEKVGKEGQVLHTTNNLMNGFL